MVRVQTQVCLTPGSVPFLLPLPFSTYATSSSLCPFVQITCTINTYWVGNGEVREVFSWVHPSSTVPAQAHWVPALGELPPSVVG